MKETKCVSTVGGQNVVIRSWADISKLGTSKVLHCVHVIELDIICKVAEPGAYQRLTVKEKWQGTLISHLVWIICWETYTQDFLISIIPPTRTADWYTQQSSLILNCVSFEWQVEQCKIKLDAGVAITNSSRRCNGTELRILRNKEDIPT
jgi:hypothetical protein